MSEQLNYIPGAEDFKMPSSSKAQEKLKDNFLVGKLREKCVEPIKNVQEMPEYSFKDFENIFRNSDGSVKTLVEINRDEKYQQMISKGFILGYDNRTYDKKDIGLHLGVDYMLKEGSSVQSIADGKVVIEKVSRN